MKSSLSLVPIAVDHVETLYARVDAQRERLGRWFPWVATTRSIDDYRSFVDDACLKNSRMDALILTLLIGGVPSGCISLHQVSKLHRSAMVGYWIAEEEEGRGRMREALKTLSAHAFGPMGLHRLELRAAVQNVRSRAVARRAGFREEGVLRHAERVGTEIYDLVVHGRLSTDPVPNV